MTDSTFLRRLTDEATDAVRGRQATVRVGTADLIELLRQFQRLYDRSRLLYPPHLERLESCAADLLVALKQCQHYRHHEQTQAQALCYLEDKVPALPPNLQPRR